MGKGTYTGGHTKIFVTDKGITWEVPDRPADQPDDSRRERRDDENIGRSERTVSKEARSFLSMCATAFRSDSLTDSHPKPPVALQKQIRRAGGNKRWIATDEVNALITLKAHFLLKESAQRRPAGCRFTKM
jgi:hypothetical protein